MGPNHAGPDALVYNPYDRGFTERGLDQVLLDTMRALRRVYEVRNGLDAGVPRAQPDRTD